MINKIMVQEETAVCLVTRLEQRQIGPHLSWLC